jgi:hypothetical protein
LIQEFLVPWEWRSSKQRPWELQATKLPQRSASTCQIEAECSLYGFQGLRVRAAKGKDYFLCEMLGK